MDYLPSNIYFAQLLERDKPQALATLQDINGLTMGTARFFDTSYGGTLTEIEVSDLPDQEFPGESGFFALHIHENADCSNGFQNTGEHYNIGEDGHPYHTGDLPPLLSNTGYAYSAFYDERFVVADILGRSLVIHAMRDDFTTQPSGDSGVKIACGIIMPG